MPRTSPGLATVHAQAAPGKSRPLSDLCLTRRARSLLVGAGIQTVEALCECTAADLLAIKGFGQGCLREVREELARAARALAGETEPHWANFGDIARQRCGEQAQYASRTIDGRLGYPHLGKGLRFQGDPLDYHDVEIHRDDVEEFVRRWTEWKAGRDPFGVPLTPSEVALAKMLGAHDDLFRSAVATADPLTDVLDALERRGLVDRGALRDGSIVTDTGRALLDRARKAGVL